MCTQCGLGVCVHGAAWVCVYTVRFWVCVYTVRFGCVCTRCDLCAVGPNSRLRQSSMKRMVLLLVKGWSLPAQSCSRRRGPADGLPSSPQQGKR